MSNRSTSDSSSQSSSTSRDHFDDFQAPTIVEQLQIIHGLSKKKVYGAKPIRQPFIGDERVTDLDDARRTSLSLLPPLLPPSIPGPSIPSGRAPSHSVMGRTARANNRRKSPTTGTRRSHRSQSSRDLGTDEYPPLPQQQQQQERHNRPVHSTAAVSERRNSKAGRHNEAASPGTSAPRRTNPYPPAPPPLNSSLPPAASAPFLMSPINHLNYQYHSQHPSPASYTRASPVLMSPVTDASSPSSSQASPLLPDNEPSFISTYRSPQSVFPMVAPVDPRSMTHHNNYPYPSEQIQSPSAGPPPRTSSSSSLSGWAG